MLKKLLEDFKAATPDIKDHLDTLTELASKCDHVTEFGYRYGASFCALLLGKPKILVTYDLIIPKDSPICVFEKYKDDTQIAFFERSTLDVDIETTDMLFIDTLHTYGQLSQELYLHGNRPRKYLVFHDTAKNAFGERGEDQKTPGLLRAIEEFLSDNAHWKIKEHFEHNNGLTILERTWQPNS